MSNRQPTPNILDQLLGSKPAPALAPTQVVITNIRTDGGTQMRAALDDATVFEYTQAMIQANGWGAFPPVVAYYDGSVYWLGDGFHRVRAYRDAFPASADGIPCEVRSGTRRDAILHAAGANASHGLRRTNADKQRAVETLLRDNEWAAWSNSEIARRCAVDEKTVRTMRAKLETTSEVPKSDSRKGADGRTINTAAIGKRATKAERATELTPQVVEYARLYRDRYGRTAYDLDPDSAAHTNSTFWSDIKKAWRQRDNKDDDVLKQAIKAGLAQLQAERQAPRPQPTPSPEQRQYESAVQAAPLDAVTVRVDSDGTPTDWEREEWARAQATVDRYAPTPAPATRPGELPADLASRGWELKRVGGVGKWYANNRSGPRATGVHERPEDAIAEAYTMQRDLAWEAQAQPAPDAGEAQAFEDAGMSLRVAHSALRKAHEHLAGHHEDMQAAIAVVISDVQALIKDLAL